MMGTPKCFIDQDGVLADFVGGMCKAQGLPSPYLNAENYGKFNMEDMWDMPEEDFWKPANNREFWENLDRLPDADELIMLACELFGDENVAILTAPSEDPNCIGGKTAWIKRHYPTFKNRIIFGSAKEFLAGPNKYLIDDRDRNVERFIQAGGIGITVPRLWNRLYHLTDRSMAEVESRLRLEMAYDFKA